MNCLERISLESGHRRWPEPPDNNTRFIILLLSFNKKGRGPARTHDLFKSFILALCTHRVVQEVLVGQAQAVFQLSLVGPAQIGGLGHIQQLAGSAVGLGGIPLDLAGVANDLGNQLGQLLDGQFLAGTSVDRLVAGVVVHQEDAQVCQIVHIQELTQRRAIAPAGNAGQVLLLGLMETTDQCRDHVAVGGVIVVVGAIEVSGHDADVVGAILTVQELAVLIFYGFWQLT